jgi:hypothetical protein
MNQYYQAITMKHKRSMAQVEVDTLEHLPLKIQTEILTEIEIFVRRIHQIITKKDIYMSDLDRKEEYQNLIKQINYAAKKLYLDKSIS